MGRLPFKPPDKSDKDPTLSVSQVAGRIGTALRSSLSDSMRIIGQVSGFRARTHWYFDLKDADAVLGCVMWQSAARRLAFTPSDGQEVVITASVDFYAKQGRLSLVVTRIEPVGAGALELAYRALCDELRGLGWFEHDRKRALPSFPRCVGVITSRSSAAFEDVKDTMRRRCPAVEIALIDARMQGDGAAREIVRAIRWAGRRGRGLDALLITRGGGSMEDLWSFNDRAVAEAIMSSEIPVVAAIGHETDTTIAELVADARGATPTQAAMLLTPDSKALEEQLDAAEIRLAGRLRHLVDMRSRHVASLSSRPCLADPMRIIAMAAQRLGAAGQRMTSSTRSSMSARQNRVERAASRLEKHRPVAVLARRESRVQLAEVRLERSLAGRLTRLTDQVEMLGRELRAVGPISVLERGFSCTTTNDGALVRSPQEVAPGDRIHTRLASGTIASRVEGKRRERLKAPGRPQMDLFDDEP